MSLVDRVNRTLAESRAITSVPWTPWNDPTWGFNIGGPAHPSRMAGTGTVDAALSLQPVYSAARLLADNVAALPLQQYRDTGDRKQKMPLGQLLSKPSMYGTSFDWLFIAMTSLVLQGNAYGLITSRDGYSLPTNVEWLPPERMEVKDSYPYNPTKAQFFYNGNEIPRESLLHIRGFTVAGRTAGISPMRAFQMYIENGLEALGYGTGWYKAGGFPPGTFKNSQYEVDDEQSAKIKAKLVSAMRRREPLVYGQDWDYKPIAVPPNEAQFIQAMQLNATQIAAIYGVPPHRIGGSSAGGGNITYSNAEAEQIGLITDTLDPWLVRIEHALRGQLPERQYAKFNRDARIRTDTVTRHQVYQIDRNIGLHNIDELRDLEDLAPIPGGKGKDYTPLTVLIATAGNRSTPVTDLASETVAGKQGPPATGPGHAPGAPPPTAPTAAPSAPPPPPPPHGAPPPPPPQQQGGGAQKPQPGRNASVDFQTFLRWLEEEDAA